MSIEFEQYKEIRQKPEEAAATLIDFTDEEGYGRFLDLHAVYELFINIKGIPVRSFLLIIRNHSELTISHIYNLMTNCMKYREKRKLDPTSSMFTFYA